MPQKIDRKREKIEHCGNFFYFHFIEKITLTFEINTGQIQDTLTIGTSVLEYFSDGVIY